MEIRIASEPTGSIAPGAPAIDPGTPQPVTRPDYVPEKFWKDGKVDTEGMAKSYTELEQKQSKPPAETPPAAAPDAKIALKAVTDAGFDLKALAKEFTDNGGKLTDATVVKLGEKGVPKEAVDAYVAGVQARATEIVNEITQAVGGADKLKSVYQWAEANLAKEDIEAYNEIMDAGNIRTSKFAFAGLLAQFDAANGQDPALITSETTPIRSGAAPFANAAQVTQAMRDPRYATDEAYRQEIAKRLAVTDVFGVR